MYVDTRGQYAILVFPSGNPRISRVYMVRPPPPWRSHQHPLSMIRCIPESATDPVAPSGSRPLLFPTDPRPTAEFVLVINVGCGGAFNANGG
ncbi:hypothetical protein BHE74_00026612 [Ensete ventricosum]|nr:hypothetical protein BHE74_00026612 [Ensete ventricosum]RZR92739.1 hypothetical protein BHM03_00021094 [Ensete ventricosum]